MAFSVNSQSGGENYVVNINNPSGHHWQSDLPKDMNGGDTAPNPKELVLSGLAACTTVTMQMYAQKKGWDLQHVEVELVIDPDGEVKEGQPHVIKRHIHIEGNLDETQKQRLLQVAEACPVHKLLVGSINIDSAIDLN